MKMNKKGFTLAELLIVIAIIAILIGIAIPAFSSQLENAQRQTDHANLRSAYAIVQTANLNGTPIDTSYFYLSDGSFGDTADKAVTIKTGKHGAAGGNQSCNESSVSCTGYAKGGKIGVAADAANPGFQTVTPIAPAP